MRLPRALSVHTALQYSRGLPVRSGGARATKRSVTSAAARAARSLSYS